MDFRLTNHDITLSANGDWEITETDAEAVTQDITMALRTWQGETPYDISVGLPYLQVFFVRGTPLSAVYFITQERIASRDGVDKVLELNLDFSSSTREATFSGRVLVAGQPLAFETGAVAA